MIAIQRLLLPDLYNLGDVESRGVCVSPSFTLVMPVPPVHIEADPANPGAFPIKLPALDDTMGALLVGTFIGLMCVFAYSDARYGL